MELDHWGRGHVTLHQVTIPLHRQKKRTTLNKTRKAPHHQKVHPHHMELDHRQGIETLAQVSIPLVMQIRVVLHKRLNGLGHQAVHLHQRKRQ